MGRHYATPCNCSLDRDDAISPGARRRPLQWAALSHVLPGHVIHDAATTHFHLQIPAGLHVFLFPSFVLCLPVGASTSSLLRFWGQGVSGRSHTYQSTLDCVGDIVTGSLSEGVSRAECWWPPVDSFLTALFDRGHWATVKRSIRLNDKQAAVETCTVPMLHAGGERLIGFRLPLTINSVHRRLALPVLPRCL